MQPMNNIPSPINRKPPRRILRKFFFGVAILFGVLLVYFAVWRIQLRREINARIAAIREQGLPTNWDELTRWHSDVADDENAALIFLQAIEHLHFEAIPGFKLAQPDFLPVGKDIPIEARSLIEAAVQTNGSALEIIYNVAKLTQSHYPINYSN